MLVYTIFPIRQVYVEIVYYMLDMQFNWASVMKFNLIVILFVGLVSCQKSTPKSQVKVVGHGGMGLAFSGSIHHDNSREAFQMALDMKGCDGIEIDVRLSKDGDLWAFHNESLETETDNEGCIEELNFSNLNGTKYNGFGREKLMRLKDLNLVTYDKMLFLDVKHYNACSGEVIDAGKYLVALGNLPEYYKNTNQVFVVLSKRSWVPMFLSAGYSVIYASEDLADIDEVFQLYPNTAGLMIKNANISQAEVQKYNDQNKMIYLFEVRSPKKIKEARKKNPLGILSDDVPSAVVVCG